jgi:hypothetical protein
LGQRGLCFVHATTGEDGLGPLAGKLLRGFEANAAFGTSDDDRFAGQIGDVLRRPVLDYLPLSWQYRLEAFFIQSVHKDDIQY